MALRTIRKALAAGALAAITAAGTALLDGTLTKAELAAAAGAGLIAGAGVWITPRNAEAADLEESETEPA